MKTDQQIAVPAQTGGGAQVPSVLQLISRAYFEANNIGGGGFTAGRNTSGLYLDDTPGAAAAGRNASGLFVSSA